MQTNPAIPNRRKYTRLVAGEPCCITFRNHQFAGELIDESINGFRIGNFDLISLARNQRVCVEYKGEQIEGYCRSIVRLADSNFAVGVAREWERDQGSAEATKSVLLRTYIRCGELKVVCQVLAEAVNWAGEVTGEENDRFVRVGLLDGKEFTLPRSEVFSLTVTDRRAELVGESPAATAANHQALAAVYEYMLGSIGSLGDQDIVGFEFGINE